MKFALLVALARGASVLLLDEPWNGLDPPSRIELSAALRAAAQEHDSIFVISSHDLNEVGALCDRFLMLDEGRIVSDEDRSQISTDGDGTRHLAAKFARAGDG